jgi:hypothetical protein
LGTPARILFEWDPKSDPEVFIDVACDELDYALGLSSTPFGAASESQHLFVKSVGGIRWTPAIGRRRQDPVERLQIEFGDCSRILQSVYGALRKDLETYSLHLTENALYILSEVEDQNRHCVPLKNFYATSMKGPLEWNVLECLSEESMRSGVSPDEHMDFGTELKVHSFLKVNSEPPWEEFAERIIRQAARCMPSLCSEYQKPDKPKVEVCFLQTIKGAVRIPLKRSDFEAVRTIYAGDADFVAWMKTQIDSLPQRNK